MLGDDDDGARRGELPQRERGEQPDRPRSGHEHRVAVGDLGPARQMHGAGERLDEHGPLVRQVVRHRAQLRPVGGQPLAPPAPGRGAVPRLQSWLEVADRHPLAVVTPALGARPARLQAAGLAREHRVDDDAGAPGQVLAVLGELRHDLVAEHARQRRHPREVQGRGPRDRAEVRTADARQARPQPGPAGGPDVRLGERDEAQGGHRPDEQARDRGAGGRDGAGDGVAGDRAEQLDGQHHPADPATPGQRRPTAAAPLVIPS